MEQSYKEKYEDILARLAKAKNDDDVCDERFCCVINDLIPELAESEDEKVRKEIINYFQCQSEEEPTRKEIHNKWIAWLENIPYTIDHEKREGFHLGYRTALDYAGGFCVLKKNEQSMVSAEESLGVDSDTYNKIVDECIFGEQKQEWSEEDKDFMYDTLSNLTELKDRYGEGYGNVGKCIGWLKSLKPQPKQSLDEDTQQWIDTIIKDYEDLYNTDKDHRATIQAKISILKSLRPQNRWKPSDEQMEALDIEKACDAFCKVRCQGSPPRSTCTSLGTCKEYDNFRKAVRRKVYE